MTLSIGIAGAVSADTVRRIAPVVESVGYKALWINDTSDGDALEKLAVAAEVTSKIGLATGVLPLDRWSSADILARVRDLPGERLTLGVGSGQSRRPLGLLERGIAELRAGTDVPILVGALGPRARQLAAEVADGILFSWLTPAAAAQAREQLWADAGGRPVRSVLYARTIADPGARDELAAEVARYASYPNYAANFARLGIDPADTTIELKRPGSTLGFQKAADEVVLRLITRTGSADELVHAIRTRAVSPNGDPRPGTTDGYYRHTIAGRPGYWKLYRGQDFRLVDGEWVGENIYKYGPSWWTLTGELDVDKIDPSELPEGAPL